MSGINAELELVQIKDRNERYSIRGQVRDVPMRCAGRANTASMICRVNQLPTELVISIFCWVQWLCGWTWTSGPVDYERSRSWLMLTWVCHQWRMVALSSPALWTYIYCCKTPVDPTWVAAVIERSSGIPLDIEINQKGDAEIILRAVLAQNVAVRNLTVQTSEDKPHEKQLPALLTLLPASMPALQGLRLMTFSERVVDSWHTRIPDRAQFPLLRELSLCGFHFPWESRIYEALLFLDLSSISYLPSASRFFQILVACPRLESLTYTQYELGKELFSAMDATKDMVTLPCLRSLKMAGALPDVEYVYDRLHVPSSCSISTSYIDGDPHDQQRIPARDMLPRHRIFLDRLPTTTFLSLAILEDVRVSLLFESDGTVCETDISGCCVRGPMLNPEKFETLLNVFANAPLTHFRLRDQDGWRTLRASTWLSFFVTFPHLASLDVGPTFRYTLLPDEDFHPLLEALNAYRTDTGELYARRLRTLTLCNVVIDGCLANKLLFVVRLRAVRGGPLGQLVLKHAIFAEDVNMRAYTAQLKKHVEVYQM
ncbi:hypothetical protein PYCCODRAFT_1470135 [Trametes coccinea BRFM310]|uniref:Uncharacterized protein n=1 Tax=Trametes coccinea (strain BRFM310) TaxID=1353009 RepID=A0A1Y2IGH7_TRAC3|nr:hypothetical protein PYCCODRAFT_1470135 [Trametes coccinea BRFM310]